MYRLILIVCALIAGISHAQHYYQPDQPGHGLTVQSVGSGYVAQWYTHDGDQQRWFISDVCAYGEPCPAYAVRASGFPAVNASLIDVGTITLIPDGDGVILDYDLSVREIGCWTLPGPLPPQCRDDDGPNRSLVYQQGFDASGTVSLELLVD